MEENHPPDEDIAWARQLLLNVWTDVYNEQCDISDFEQSILTEAEELRDFLIDRDTRTFCILSVSFMEDTLRKTFCRYWDLNSKAQMDEYFGSNGPLSTFAQRVSVAAALEWLQKEMRDQTNILRKIRNEFAHNHKVHSLSDSSIIGLATSLKAWDEVWYKDDMPTYREAYDHCPLETRLRMRIYCSSVSVVSNILSRAKLIRAQVPANFRAGSGFASFTGVEQAFIDHMIRHCFKTLGISRSGSS